MDFITWLSEPCVVGKEFFNKGQKVFDINDFEKPEMTLDEFYDLPEFMQIALETAYDYEVSQREVMKAEQYYDERLGK